MRYQADTLGEAIRETCAQLEQPFMKIGSVETMESREIYITEFDLFRLKELVNVGISFKERDREYLESLQNELDRAQVVEPESIPHDIVTMNSHVCIEDVETGMRNEYTLVFPSEARIAEKKVSILAPIGTAMLGCRIGDIVDWPVPAGHRRVRIADIPYQPEAAGHYDL